MVKKIVYIAGGIGSLTQDSVVSYFNSVKESLEMAGFEVRSPIRGKILDTRELQEGGEYCQRYEPNEIVHRDLWDIKTSDFIIAMPSEYSIGTFMEIALARVHFEKPVIIVSNDSRISQHYWIQAFASKIFNNLDDAIEYIITWYL